MKRIYFFDFDGTITIKDTFVHLILRSFGMKKFVLGFLKFAPYLLLMKLKLYPNYRVKQQVFSHFFKNMEETKFNAFCETYCQTQYHIIIKQSFLNYLQEAKKNYPKAEFVIVSASIHNWIAPFAKQFDVQLIATEIQCKNGRLTGTFRTPNCYGREKANRIHQQFNLCAYTTSLAFGDSRGDMEMLELVNEKFFRFFL